MIFPIKGKKWCFSRSVDPFAAQSPSGVTPTTVRGLWKKISSESKPINANAELLVDFISDKVKIYIETFSLYIIHTRVFLWRLVRFIGVESSDQ